MECAGVGTSPVPQPGSSEQHGAKLCAAPAQVVAMSDQQRQPKVADAPVVEVARHSIASGEAGSLLYCLRARRN